MVWLPEQDATATPVAGGDAQEDDPAPGPGEGTFTSDSRSLNSKGFEIAQASQHSFIPRDHDNDNYNDNAASELAASGRPTAGSAQRL